MFWVNAKSAQVVAVLFEYNQKNSLKVQLRIGPCGFVSSNQECGDLYVPSKWGVQ